MGAYNNQDNNISTSHIRNSSNITTNYNGVKRYDHKVFKCIYYLQAGHPHKGLSQQRSSLRNSPTCSHRRSSFGRLFHTRTPSCVNDLSPYLDVLDLGTTTGLVLLIEYLEVFSSMRFLMKEGDILFTILNTSHAMRFLVV